jgi:NAD-dependent deacetylase
MINTLYITGAGVSAESGIPTFRGQDGFWTIGSKNYTPMEMATRAMYMNKPEEFLAWYYHRFATYRNHGPNVVHEWLANKNLITQNIDVLDVKAGNKNYIAIHGRLDQMTLFTDQDNNQNNIISHAQWDQVDADNLIPSLLDLFKINLKPELNISLKPYVLLFDEYYTNLYRIDEAQQRINQADKIIFMGTSFSVNITNMALDTAIKHNIPVEVVDPNPVILPYRNVTYHKCSASEFIKNQS